MIVGGAYTSNQRYADDTVKMADNIRDLQRIVQSKWHMFAMGPKDEYKYYKTPGFYQENTVL